MPNDLILKTMNAVHRGVLALTGGRIGYEASNMPVLELTTIGRKSGRPHAVMLTSPIRDGSAYVVVASRGGDDHHPAWFVNLRDNPEVEVAVKGGPKHKVRARIADDETRARLWPQIAREHKNYAGYQNKTERQIPLVLLDA